MKVNRDRIAKGPAAARPSSADANNSRSMLALAVSAALCGSPQGQAQQAQQAKSSDLTLEEIVVTASLRRTNMQDLPQSITVLTTEDIEKAGYKEMGDYIKDLPSVTLNQLQPGRNNIVFRGVSTNAEDFYTDAQAGVYLDDQPITTNATQVSPYLVDIERVEALPGPQGTLFGSSAETGVLRIITNKPDPSGLSGQVSATGFATQGGTGSYEVDGHLNIPLIDDKLTARIVGFYSQEGGWIDNVYGQDLAHHLNNADAVKTNSNVWTVEGVRLAALWTINDKVNALFNLTTQNDTTKGDWLSDPYLGDAKITRFIEDSRHDNWYQAAMTVTADLGFAEFKSTSAYFDRHMTYTQDNMTYEQYKAKVYGSYNGVPGTQQNGTPAANVYDTRLLGNDTFTTSTTFNNQWQYRFSQEFRLTSKGDSALQWLGGLFYERVHDNWWYGTQNLQFMNTYAWKFVNDPASYGSGAACYYHGLGYNVQCPLPPTTIIYGDSFDRLVKQFAVFGEASYKLNDKWSVIGGGRWFRYDRNVTQTYQVPQGVPVGLGSGSPTSSGNESATLGKFSVQYKFKPDVMGYLLFSQGYRLGGFNSERAAASGAVPFQYQPDKLNNFELGMKSQWLDRRITLNASLFLMKWTDIQLYSSTSGASGGAWWKRGTINGGSAENSGLELSGAARLTRQWTVDFNMTAANPHLTEPVTYANGRYIPEGTQMVGAPDFKGTVGVEYAFDWKPAGGDLWARFDYSYQSATYQSLYYASAAYQNAVNDAGIPQGWGRVEPWRFAKFQVGATLPNKLAVTLTLNNAFNSKGANWVSTAEGWYSGQFGDPRYKNLQAQFRPQSIGLTLRKDF